MEQRLSIEEAIAIIALRERITVDEVRRQMELAMSMGLASKDPAVQAHWNRIPRKGDVPTPEELIEFLADNPDLGIEH